MSKSRDGKKKQNQQNRRRLAAGVLAGLCLCAVPQAPAARIPFREQQVSYDLQGEALKDFLQRFFDDQGLALVLSPQVQASGGTLNGPRSGSAAGVFKGIADSNNLVAYYDGSVVYVYKTRELANRYFHVDPSRVDTFRQTVAGYDLADASDSYQLHADSGLVTLSGTPRFIEQMSQLGSALGRAEGRIAIPQQQLRLAQTTLHLITLKYAWAADTTFNVGSQQTVVPGVATLLRQLIGQGGPGASGGSLPAQSATAGLRGRGLAALGDRIAQASGAVPATAGGGSAAMGAAQPGYGATPVPAGAAPAATLLDGGDGPRIVADPYRNALIIRDLPERMAMYDQLVAQLDVESPIIQLDATIIDVDKTKAQQIGINWGYTNGGTSVLFGGGLYPVDALGNLAGLQVSAIVGNTAQFLSRVNALAQDGVTSVVQRPQVVTLNDAEAVIESTQSIYVPVSGAFDEDLYNIVAGTVLRVTPHMIVDNGRQRIRLLVTIEDGNVTLSTQSSTTSNGQTLNQAVPLVTRNAVNTQAVIDTGQGLLLGGLNRREDDKTVTKIPGLGDLPLIGHLFRSDTTKHETTERLFLIAPHLITASAAPAVPVQPAPQAPGGGDAPSLVPAPAPGGDAAAPPTVPVPAPAPQAAAPHPAAVQPAPGTEASDDGALPVMAYDSIAEPAFRPQVRKPVAPAEMQVASVPPAVASPIGATAGVVAAAAAPVEHIVLAAPVVLPSLRDALEQSEEDPPISAPPLPHLAHAPAPRALAAHRPPPPHVAPLPSVATQLTALWPRGTLE